MMHNKSTDAPLSIYVDVDDTLVRSYGSKRIPIPAVIQHVRALHTQNVILFCWSAGGADYAQQTARELGIEDCFTAFLPKPNVMIDDQKATEWPRTISIHPSSCNNHTVEEYQNLLR